MSLQRFILKLLSLIFALGATTNSALQAQAPEVQQKVSEIKQQLAANRQALAQYSWVEQDTIILKGEQKKQEHFQVRLGPDGKPQKASLDAPAAQAPPSGGRLKQRVIQKKKEEYEDYANQIKALVQQYMPPQSAKLEQAHANGNISLSPATGGSQQYQLVISNYVKQGDKMTLVFDRSQKAIVSLSIASYLNDPKDAVNVDAQFTRIPGGPNHASAETINGVSKQLTISIQNSNYQKVY